MRLAWVEGIGGHRALIVGIAEVAFSVFSQVRVECLEEHALSISMGVQQHSDSTEVVALVGDVAGGAAVGGFDAQHSNTAVVEGTTFVEQVDAGCADIS